MCFNHQADGVLGVNTPKQLNRMSSVGKLHWGLDFQGVSIGNKKMKVGFCDPSTKKPGMEWGSLDGESRGHLLAVDVLDELKRCW
eukprot:symbB.v1.2.012609.t1/scaffold874.1/size155782/3